MGAFPVTAAEHRELGKELFNRVWTLLELPSRTPAEDDELVHAAHASRYHWGASEAPPANLARGEWQCSRVYAVLGHPEEATYHARRTLDICDDAGLTGFVHAEANEALARALLVAGDRAGAAAAEAAAWADAEGIDDEEERQIFEQDMATLPR